MKSFKITKRILTSRGQQGRVNIIDEDILKQLICLLKPFKHVLQLIQIGDEPSLYMVLICSLTLRRTLGSFDEILKYQSSIEMMKEQPRESDTDEELEIPFESEGKAHFFVFCLTC
jgi:hypothetical protein